MITELFERCCHDLCDETECPRLISSSEVVLRSVAMALQFDVGAPFSHPTVNGLHPDV